MESIKPKGSKSKIVATHEGVLRKSTQLFSRVDNNNNDKNVVVGKGDKFVPKIVCGLPCATKEKERELTYTLDILSGIGIRRVEEIKPRIRGKEV
jgi:hypothetical protein